ncbi:MAG: hypothetical protein HZC41_24255 [Chloroflexi bacterium]|nr:hypothetical protein [Chloroflexota bacterium]
MYTLSTLHQLRQRLGLADSDTADDARLLEALHTATAQIERAAERRFCPRRADVKHSITNSRELLLDDDLLELVALTNGDGSAIPTANALLLPPDGPAGALRLVGGSAFTWAETPVNAITVTGIWGWHDHWDEAWRGAADTVRDNPLAAGATILTVADADGADSMGEAPRFQVGQLLKIEDEYLWVLAVNPTTNVLTVQRGANGTTAAPHALNTPVSVYQPPADVAALALRRAAWLYKEPDNPAFAPDSLEEALASLRRLGVKA